MCDMCRVVEVVAGNEDDVGVIAGSDLESPNN